MAKILKATKNQTEEGVDLIAAPYDWRFAPSVMEKREGSLVHFFAFRV